MLDTYIVKAEHSRRSRLSVSPFLVFIAGRLRGYHRKPPYQDERKVQKYNLVTATITPF
jgi:hypothetical protein